MAGGRKTCLRRFGAGISALSTFAPGCVPAPALLSPAHGGGAGGISVRAGGLCGQRPPSREFIRWLSFWSLSRR